MPEDISILVVDDEQAVREMLCEAIEEIRVLRVDVPTHPLESTTTATRANAQTTPLIVRLPPTRPAAGL